MQKITTFLWFDDNAVEAVEFYTSIFKDSKVLRTSYYSEAGPAEPGTVMTVEFQLAGQDFVALNGGPAFTFTEAISLSVSCEDQAEVDELWSKLLEGGGSESQCGWLKDKYGLSWQIVPKGLTELMSGPDPARSAAVARALFTMVKIDIAELRRAYDGAGE